MRKRVLVNGISFNLGGSITVIRHLLDALLNQDQEYEYHLLVPGSISSVFSGFDQSRIRLIPFSAFSKETLWVERLLSEQVFSPIRLCFKKYDLVFSMGGVAILASPIPQVLMYQNMAPFEPKVVASAPHNKRLRLWLLKQIGIVSGRLSQKIIFLSRYAQRSIVPLLKNKANDSYCIYLGHDPLFSPLAANNPKARQMLQSLGIKPPYLLCVSHFYHYKNLKQLVIAFAKALPHIPQNIQLAMVGAEHEKDYAQEVRKAVSEWGIWNRVVFTGAVPYEKMPGIYANALAFFFPSTVETFPNILLEAMASGAPAFASGLGPIPEIARSGVFYFDPNDVDEMARVIRLAVENEGLRQTLRKEGIKRARQFSWKRMAQEVLSVFDETLKVSPLKRTTKG
ncbi:MAG: glycosyltransferase family 4 protein [Sandaracinaceae bacterium]|nr:glycosyltransferase family 4 protein [Sandaracinaceae bacterium]